MSAPPLQPLVLPRGLILVASVWLVASWSVAIGFRPPVEASSASYTPGVRLMLISAAIGLVIGWPMLRLSLDTAPYPIKQTVLDLVVLLALVQVVVWPLRLVTPWSPARTAALDATLVAWTVLAGAMVASAVGTRRAGPRNIAIIACMCMCLAGPSLAILMLHIRPLDGFSHRLLQVGPLLEVERKVPEEAGHRVRVAVVQETEPRVGAARRSVETGLLVEVPQLGDLDRLRAEND